MIANTQFDEEQYICDLVNEIVFLTKNAQIDLENRLYLIREKAKCIKRKAQKWKTDLKNIK